MVNRGGLENRCTFTGTGGSNPSASASDSITYGENERVPKGGSQAENWASGTSDGTWSGKTKASTACFKCFGPRWAYRCVISIE